MKNILTSSITLILLIGITFLSATYMDASFIDFAFFVGMFVSFIIHFFSSSGGFFSDSIRSDIQSATGIIQEREKSTFTISLPFLISLLYTIISFIILIIVYWDHFF